MHPSNTAPAAIGTPAFYRDPYPTYRALLDSATRAVRLAPNYVAVTHYQDCLDVLRDPRLSAVRTKNRLAHLTDEQRRTAISSPGTLEAMMLFTDPPEHTRVRRLLHGFFSPESLFALRPRINGLLQRPRRSARWHRDRLHEFPRAPVAGSGYW